MLNTARAAFVCKMEDVYCNMKEYIMPVYEIIERAENAMRAAGIEPHLSTCTRWY